MELPSKVRSDSGAIFIVEYAPNSGIQQTKNPPGCSITFERPTYLPEILQLLLPP